jgi:hypothetical protein
MFEEIQHCDPHHLITGGDIAQQHVGLDLDAEGWLRRAN